MALPIEVQQDVEILRYNEELRSLRAKFAQGVSQMQSFAFSMKRSFASLVVSMVEKIDSITDRVEVLVVPSNDFADFRNGDKTLDEYAELDTLRYYNDLKKIKASLNGISVALMLLTDSRQQPLASGVINNSTAIDVLDETEFLEQGFLQPVFEQEYDIKLYTIRRGDTLQDIAARELGDSKMWIDIAKINKISNNDIIDDGTIIGQTIKIPVYRTSVIRRNKNNLVYEKQFNGDSQSKIEQFLYGGDIELFRSADKKQGVFIVDETKDIKHETGVDTAVNNIIDRFNVRKGNLNPLHPDFGIAPISENGQAPYIIALEKLLVDMENQGSRDPRVSNTTVQRSTVKIVGDAMYVDIDFHLIGGSNTKRNQKIPTL